jgi:glycosyltransferase involved in cell wall biosynthesis
LDVVLQRTVTLRRTWKHPQGFSEPIFVHLPIDTFAQLRRFHPDVVISNEMGFRTLIALLYRKTHPRSRIIVWCEMGEASEQGRGSLRNFIRRRVPKHADAFVTLGASGIRYLRSIGANEEQIFRIPCTADVTHFAQTPLERYSPEAHRLLYVGQIIERKGLLPFLSVLCAWAERNPTRQIEWVFAGDGPLRPKLEAHRVPPNLHLRFLGNLAYDSLPNLYSEAGIFAFPTLADTWGVVVNEAMASGLPVLGSRYAQAVDELVSEGQTGWLFRPDRSDETYTAIERALSTPIETLNQMRKRARETAVQLTPDHIASLIENAVSKCIATGPVHRNN